MPRQRFAAGRRVGLAAVVGVVVGGCASTPPSPGGTDECPTPSKPTLVIDARTNGQLLRTFKDDQGHDLEVWCVNGILSYRLSFPDGHHGWLALCSFHDGRNATHFVPPGDGPWTGVGVHNLDPKPVKDNPNFDDLEFEFSWLKGELTVSFTRGGRVVFKHALPLESDWEKFTQALVGMEKEFRRQSGVPGQPPEGAGQHCSGDDH